MPDLKKIYLGDGAYVAEDGYGGIRISSENGVEIFDEVCLGVSELARLEKFIKEHIHE